MSVEVGTGVDDLADMHRSLSKLWLEILGDLPMIDPRMTTVVSSLLTTMDELRKVRDRLNAIDAGGNATGSATTSGSGST